MKNRTAGMFRIGSVVPSDIMGRFEGGRNCATVMCSDPELVLLTVASGITGSEKIGKSLGGAVGIFNCGTSFSDLPGFPGTQQFITTSVMVRDAFGICEFDINFDAVDADALVGAYDGTAALPVREVLADMETGVVVASRRLVSHVLQDDLGAIMGFQKEQGEKFGDLAPVMYLQAMEKLEGTSSISQCWDMSKKCPLEREGLIDPIISGGRYV